MWNISASKFVICRLQTICLGQTKTGVIVSSSHNPHKVSKIYSCDYKSVQVHMSDTCRRRQFLLGSHLVCSSNSQANRDTVNSALRMEQRLTVCHIMVSGRTHFEGNQHTFSQNLTVSSVECVNCCLSTQDNSGVREKTNKMQQLHVYF